MHKRQFAFAIAVAFIAGAFSSCSHLAKAQPMEGTSIAVQILATVRLVSTENILESTFREDVAKLEASRGKALSAEERSLYLEDVINDILFYQMCERDGIKVSDGEIDAYIAKLRLQRPPEETEDEFKAFLVKQGVEYEDLRTNYKKQVLIQRWLMSAKAAEISTELAVQTKEILDMYELYKSKLVRPDTVKLSFLLSQYKDGSEEERA
ncbi:MAG: SurA N-terminal domain-containing protein, partial [Spirochaetales bacterium]|nr:SurA N-terminal domain-containing protein [Spirochaetales bacterium]